MHALSVQVPDLGVKPSGQAPAGARARLGGVQRDGQPERARAAQRRLPRGPCAGGRVARQVDADHAAAPQRRRQLHRLERRGGALAPVDAEQQPHRGARAACAAARGALGGPAGAARRPDADLGRPTAGWAGGALSRPGLQPAESARQPDAEPKWMPAHPHVPAGDGQRTGRQLLPTLCCCYYYWICL